MVSKVIYDIDIDKQMSEISTGFWLRLENGKEFSSQGFWTDRKSQEKSQNTGKVREFQTNFIYYFLWYTNELCIIWLKFSGN